MSLFAILVIIFLIFLLRPIFSGIMMARKYRRAMKEAYARASRGGFGGFGFSPGGSRQEPAGPAPKKKVYTKDMGEYVAYEEITVTKTVETHTADADTITEEQVTDAEWEEIR